MSPRGADGPLLVVFHAASLGAISFIMSANGMALPQLFYQRLHAHDKVLLLAICLFMGTCGSIAGVLASRAARGSVRIALAATFAAEGALFAVTGAIVYASLNAAAQVGANYAMNHLDHAATARAGSRRRLHDAASNAVRLSGMLAAPLVMTALYLRRAAILAVLAVAFAIASASAASLDAHGAHGAHGADARRAVEARPVDRAGRLLFGFAACVYTALYLLAANLIYLLRDVVGLADAERRGGSAIVVVFGAALVANASASALRRRRASERRGVLALASPLPALAIAAAVLSSGAKPTYGHVLAGCAAVGLGYGVFLAELRERASEGARERGETGLLTLFNNLANVSSLIAFAAMIAIAAATRGETGRAYQVVLAIVGLLPWAGLPLLLASTARSARAQGAT